MKDKNENEQIPYWRVVHGPFHNVGISMTDPLGSYTGAPILPDEDPVQDADDL